MEEHPSPEKLRGFVEGTLDRDEARRVVAHFLEGCRSCGDEAVRYNLQRLSGRERRPEMDHALLSLLQASEMVTRRL